MATKKTDKSDDSMFESENVGKAKPRKRRTKKVKKEIVTEESPVAQYVHPDIKRKNNPPVGMVDPQNDPDLPSKKYSYDPRLDPQLQWSGKTENSEFDVDTVSLHVHERIDPLTIIEKAMKDHKQVQQSLFHYFEMPENNPPLRDAIEFYKHDQNWKNRLIAGDSLLVMNSLLEKEAMEGNVQMIYFDPPYGISYGSNFQPFVNKTNVEDRNDDDLSTEPEMIKAFRDTWELKLHSYLSYLRSRIKLSRQLLHESGSCFIQISEQNVHYVRQIMDEEFGSSNFIAQIIFRKKRMPLGGKFLEYMCDYLLFYAKDKNKLKYRQLFQPKKMEGDSKWCFVELKDGSRRRMTTNEINNWKSLPNNSNPYYRRVLRPAGFNKNAVFPITLEGKTLMPKKGTSWSTSEKNVKKLIENKRLELSEDGVTVNYIVKLNDYPYTPITSHWPDTSSPASKIYAVETSMKPLSRAILMSTDPGDLVLDITCGSGSTAYVAEKFARRWITCDSSRISIAIAKQRLMCATFDYYKLRDTNVGINGGFIYKTIPHITLGSIANNEPTTNETLYDQPEIDKQKTRVSGPFTVESVPSPTVKSIDALSDENLNQTKITTQQEWREELLRTGIRGKEGQKIEFSRVASHPATKWLHGDAETKEAKPKRVMISFGPEHSPLEQRQVANAIKESQNLVPKPEIIIFVAMQFDSESAKDIDELKWPGVIILKAEMNKDLLTKDLKKKQSNNESFWLMGSPDVECEKQKDGKYIVTVNGFDYYNTKTDEIESGGSSKIAMWELDTDYDGFSVYPQQVFFPMGGMSGGWSKLAKTLKSEIDEDLITKYQGIESIPFEAGINKKIAVKIIDDRGIESLKIIDLE
jgi:adenine-specific DNA-methyltransferase